MQPRENQAGIVLENEFEGQVFKDGLLCIVPTDTERVDAVLKTLREGHDVCLNPIETNLAARGLRKWAKEQLGETANQVGTLGSEKQDPLTPIANLLSYKGVTAEALPSIEQAKRALACAKKFDEVLKASEKNVIEALEKSI